MILQLRPDEVTEWFVCFHARCSVEFWNRAIPGRWKHVRVFAFSRGCDCWIFYDVGKAGTTITLAPAGDQGNALVGQYVRDAAVLRLDRQTGPSRPSRLGFWCVPAVRHLLNLPGGALLPETLWRDCLKAGAKVILDHGLLGSGPDARSGDCGAASAGAGERLEANPAELGV